MLFCVSYFCQIVHVFLAFAGFSGIYCRLQHSVLSLTLNLSLTLTSETENFGEMSEYFKIVMRVLYEYLIQSSFVEVK